MSATKLSSSFPQFPVFKKIALEDKHVYETFYKQFEPYSDFSFNNLWIWFDHSSGLAIARHRDNLVLRLDDPFSGGLSEYTVLGKDHCVSTIRRVLRWQRAMGLEQKMVMVPAECLEDGHLRIAGLKIIEDADNHDYIYNVARLKAAEGHEYASLRRALSLFNRAYGKEVTHQDIDLSSLSSRANLVNHIHRWESTYRQDLQSFIEGTALNRYLQAVEELAPRCFAIFYKDDLISFVIYHLAPQGGYGMLNHIKCNYEYKHISDYTMYTFAVRLDELQLTYENFEQDLGIAGLRHYKQSLRPQRMLKRYVITPL